MSLRPVISGFSVDTMFGHLGSKDEDLLARVSKEFDESVKFDSPVMSATAQEVLRRAIFEGPRWPDLEVEGEPHVMAAIVLAKHGQSHLTTDSAHWKMPAFWDFIKAHHSRVSGDARKFLTMFGRGRALFGRRIDTPWSYYGFLTIRQVRTLHSGLIELRDHDSSLQGKPYMGGFLDELIGWLITIESHDKDLWFYCY